LLLRELALSYARVGDLQGKAGDAAGALASHRKGLEIFTALAEAHSDNAQAGRDLAASRARVAEVSSLVIRPSPAETNERRKTNDQ
jgi:hypothetical protein